LNSGPAVNKNTIDNKEYISRPAPKDKEELQKYLTKLVNLDYLDFHMTRHSSLNDLLFGETYITKFCRANRLLPWFAEKYPNIKMIVLIRHPCAVVASQLKHGAWDEILESDRQFPSPGEDYLDDFPEVESKIQELEYPEEQLAADWALDYLVPIKQGIPSSWLVVIYEELVSHGPKTLNKISDWLDIEIPSTAFDQLNIPSRTVSYGKDSNVVQGGNPLKTWRSRLKDEQVERILGIINKFDLGFYSEGLEPNYNRIRSSLNKD